MAKFLLLRRCTGAICGGQACFVLQERWAPYHQGWIFGMFCAVCACAQKTHIMDPNGVLATAGSCTCCWLCLGPKDVCDRYCCILMPCISTSWVGCDDGLLAALHRESAWAVMQGSRHGSLFLFEVVPAMLLALPHLLCAQFCVCIRCC